MTATIKVRGEPRNSSLAEDIQSAWATGEPLHYAVGAPERRYRVLRFVEWRDPLDNVLVSADLQPVAE